MRMRSALASLLSVTISLTVAHADSPSKAKAKPDKFVKAAGKLFEDALAADQRGDASAAAKLYEQSFEIVPHPNTAYNLADNYARDGRLDDALAYYRLYLLMAPRAPDRSDVEAAIATLERRPGSVELRTDSSSAFDLASAYVLVDGEITLRPDQVKPGARATLQLAHGPHVIDVVTETSFASITIAVVRGVSTSPSVRLEPRIEGDVVVSSLHPIFLRVDGHQTATNDARLSVSTGRHVLEIRDRDYECPPAPFIVKPGDHVTYVHVAVTEQRPLADGTAPIGCRAFVVKQQQLF